MILQISVVKNDRRLTVEIGHENLAVFHPQDAKTIIYAVTDGTGCDLAHVAQCFAAAVEGVTDDA